MDAREAGRRAEAIAAAYLQGKGWRVVERNWSCAEGELDIIAENEEGLVFVEVKGRRSERYGHPEDAVDAVKQQHLRDAAWRYLLEKGEADVVWRIDVIAVRMHPDGCLQELEHYPFAVGDVD